MYKYICIYKKEEVKEERRKREGERKKEIKLAEVYSEKIMSIKLCYHVCFILLQKQCYYELKNYSMNICIIDASIQFISVAQSV